jgi:imidazole glycerol-phosphate synthase subunit HisH
VTVTLIDSPVANVANIARALRTTGAELVVTRDPEVIADARRIVLPGVGSFVAAMRWLTDARIDVALRTAVERGAMLLGICVGHQVLFDASHEMGFTRGLGLIEGEVRRFEGALPVPQIGWNRVSYGGQAPSPVHGGQAPSPVRTGALACPQLFEGIASGTSFYFVNSYAAADAANEIARADYDGPFTAAVQRGNVFGVQFHPEKSSTAGLRVLRNFVAWK